MPEKNDSLAPLRPEAPVFLIGDLHKIPSVSIQKAHSLIRRECCNLSSGNCVFLDDGEEHTCPQLHVDSVCCSWFKDAVLSIDPELEAEILNKSCDTIKQCIVCGKPIVGKSNRMKYCHKCAIKTHRTQTAKCKRSKRINGSN
jgi:hypothetical protein